MHLEIRATKRISDGRFIEIRTQEITIENLPSTVKEINKAIETFQKDEMPERSERATGNKESVTKTEKLAQQVQTIFIAARAKAYKESRPTHDLSEVETKIIQAFIPMVKSTTYHGWVCPQCGNFMDELFRQGHICRMKRRT